MTAFFKTLYAVGEEEPKEELKKRLSAFDSYFKQNDKYLGGEPILQLRLRKEKEENLNLFFKVEHLRVLFFIQTKLLLPNFECVQKARTISDKKITLPLDSHVSLILFHLIFLDPFFFTFFDAHLLSGVHLGKCTQTTRMAGLPMKIFIVSLPLNYEAFESCTSL